MIGGPSGDLGAGWTEIGLRARKLQTDRSPQLLGVERADFLWWVLRFQSFFLRARVEIYSRL